MPVADGAEILQIPRAVKTHPTRPLNDGLDHHGRQLVGVAGQDRLEIGAVSRVVAGRHLRREHLL